MDQITADRAQKELTMILLYLSRFTSNDRLVKSDDVYSWKGYDFDVLNYLDDEDFIRQGGCLNSRRLYGIFIHSCLAYK